MSSRGRLKFLIPPVAVLQQMCCIPGKAIAVGYLRVIFNSD
jgi:hypothetical protein